MPSSITHELIAEEAARRSPRLREAAAASDYYYLGAQGPDLFFFYRPFSDNLGRALHRGQVAEWFRALLRVLRTAEGEELGRGVAYALGYCSHLAADVAFHPFVYGLLAARGDGKRMHQRVENDWDVYFLREKRGVSAVGYTFPFDVKKIAREGTLFKLLSDAARDVGRTLEAASFAAMLRRFGWYTDHFHKRHGRYLLPVLPTFYPREETDPDVLRGEHFFALSQGKAEDADALFRLAVQDSVRNGELFLRSLEEDVPLPEEFFSRHMLSGERL